MLAYMLYDELIREVGRRLVAAASSPARVVLFGSHARGEAVPGSDLDLLVIEQEITDRSAEFVSLRRSLRGLDRSIDLILVTEDEAQKWRDVPGSLIFDAMRTGQLIGEATSLRVRRLIAEDRAILERLAR